MTDWQDISTAPKDGTMAGAWQPFETAPEDGSEIIVYREDAGVFTASNVEDPDSGDGFWMTTGGEDLTRDLPTHWMPLPAPPTPKGGA